MSFLRVQSPFCLRQLSFYDMFVEEQDLCVLRRPQEINYQHFPKVFWVSDVGTKREVKELTLFRHLFL